jgi:exopolysaccharide production protein ExoZ
MIRATLSRIYELPGEASRYQSMEGLRAYAALLIFFVHYFDAFGRAAWDIDFNSFQIEQSPSVFATVCYYLFASHYGVDLFFLLSGFLICRIARKQSFKYGAFLRQRIVRIYPAFLISLTVWVVVRVFIQQWYELDISQLIGNLLFLNAVPILNVTPYSTVTWSLFYELLFYLSFPIIFFIPQARGNRGVWIAMAYGLLLVTILQIVLGGMFIRFSMFFAGILLAFFNEQQLKQVARRLPLPLVLGAYMASTLFFAAELGYSRFTPVFWITSLLLVIKVLFDTGWLTRILASEPLRHMGNISYSFYLMHGLGIEIVMRHAGTIIKNLGQGPGLLITISAAFILSFILSTVLFLIAEKWYFTWRHRTSARMASIKTTTAYRKA